MTFILYFTKSETNASEVHLRGTTIIGLHFRGNLFKDSMCSMSNFRGFSNLSKIYNIGKGKIAEINFDGKTLTSSQLCFYRPVLTFNEFLDLEMTEPAFWSEYVKYCLYDCIALSEIWGKFTENINNAIANIHPSLSLKCPVISSMTIGSHK